jgi:hypothetical protein
VLVGGEIAPVCRAVPSAHAAEHHPDGMKVVCFFAPATTLDNYQIPDGIDFPDDAPLQNREFSSISYNQSHPGVQLLRAR